MRAIAAILLVPALVAPAPAPQPVPLQWIDREPDRPSRGGRPEMIPNVYRDSGTWVWNGVPRWIRQVGYCIRRHESIEAGHYRAQNPVSSASGAYQFIQSTWSGVARWVRIARPYADGPARAAPPWVQDAVFIHVVRRGGLRHWAGTSCPGTG